jgi:hypothetical protein
VLGGVVAAVVLALVAVVVVPDDVSRGSRFMAGAEPVTPGIDAHIPAGSCVVTDDPILLIESDRWDSARPGCVPITDPFGMFVSTEGIQPPGDKPFPPSLVDPWRAALAHAQYVVLTYAGSNFVPFSPALTRSFRARFVAVFASPHAVVYRVRE